ARLQLIGKIHRPVVDAHDRHFRMGHPKRFEGVLDGLAEATALCCDTLGRFQLLMKVPPPALPGQEIVQTAMEPPLNRIHPILQSCFATVSRCCATSAARCRTVHDQVFVYAETRTDLNEKLL